VASTFPSGRQILLESGPYSAIITEVGAGLRELHYDGSEIIDGYPAESMAEACRGQILSPWTNRLKDGRWWWNGIEHVVPVDDPEKGNSASHGLVRWVPWTIVDEKPGRTVLATRLHPRPGYPFTVDFSIEYALTDSGLAIDLTAQNPTDTDTPVALGAHPYLRPLGGGSINEARLQIPAGKRVLVDEDGQPRATKPVAGGIYDFRKSVEIGPLAINHAFTDLVFTNHGAEIANLCEVTLDDSLGTVTLWTDTATRWIQVFSGDSLSGADQRRSIAIEPMTAPAGALATKTGLIVLSHEASTHLRWGISARKR